MANSLKQALLACDYLIMGLVQSGYGQVKDVRGISSKNKAAPVLIRDGFDKIVN
jgi:hypothetical protein